MKTIVKLLTAYTAWLCQVFSVSPDALHKDKRGNQPPPTGGFSSF